MCIGYLMMSPDVTPQKTPPTAAFAAGTPFAGGASRSKRRCAAPARVGRGNRARRHRRFERGSRRYLVAVAVAPAAADWRAASGCRPGSARGG